MTAPGVVEVEACIRHGVCDLLADPVSGRTGAGDHDPVIVGLNLANPQGDKGVVAADLGALLPTGDRKTDKQINKAIDSIDASLSDGWWTSDQTITNKKVFDNERSAVVQLELVVAAGGSEAAAAQAAIDVLVNADRQLAQIELIAAILLVQFVGIPFSIMFGKIPSKEESKRAFFLAFVVWNLIMLPLVGIGSQFVLGEDVTGTRPPAYEDTASAVGEGDYAVDSQAVALEGVWATDGEYAGTHDAGAIYALAYNGTTVRVHYSEGPDRGEWAILIDGAAVIEDDEEVVIDGYNSAVHEGVDIDVDAPEAGEHLLEIVNTGEADAASSGTAMVIGEATVMQPPRSSDLLAILGLLFVVEVIGLAVAVVVGRPLFSGLADTMTTKRTIILALIVYSAIAVWGFFLDSVIEFWFLAFMVAVVQGGSQALSRSLYASMSPKALSGEFFGFFSVMSKFSAIVGPLLFVAAVTVFGSSRPAILGLIVFFLVGIYLLNRVDVPEGRRVAREADEAAAAAGIVETG